jgi:hypothetical protein
VWEGVNKAKKKTFCKYFRVLVMATKHIMLFEQLTCSV